jgi:hypothetical protein
MQQKFFSQETQDQSFKFPQLPVLDSLAAKFLAQDDFPDLRKVALIGVQHMLSTTGSLLVKLHEMGIAYENMFFVGKCYSSSPQVEAALQKLGIHLLPAITPAKPGHYEAAARKSVEMLWLRCLQEIKNKDIETIMIMDEGGYCLESVPPKTQIQYKLAGLEQTRGGLYRPGLKNSLFPIINIATSAAKNQLESPHIAKALIKQVEKELKRLKSSKNKIFGIIGNGVIGNMLTEHLLAKGYDVAVYDPNVDTFSMQKKTDFYRMENIDALIANCECIFGCTGTDITKNINVDNIFYDKIFFSCSSEDRECLTLLQYATQKSSFLKNSALDISFLNTLGKKITIVNGGLPINFDKSPECVPANDIQLTRGLLLGGIIQAILSAKKLINDGFTVNKNNLQTLDPLIQSAVVQSWLHYQPPNQYPLQLQKDFANISWIQLNSGGTYHKNEFITHTFSSTQTILHAKL